MKMRVGTLPWLLRHELRLWWREIIGKWLLAILAAIGILIALFLVLWGLVLSKAGGGISLDPIPESVFWVAAIVWLVGFGYAFMQAMGQTVIAVFDRGDLDFLVSSPISSKVIFASRFLGIVLQVFLGFGLLVVPSSILVVLAGIPQLLGIYPAVIGLSLTAASLAMLLTLWLVKVLGARRARTFAQILTGIFSALLVFSTQLPSLLNDRTVASQAVWEKSRVFFERGSLLSADSWIWFPVRAIFFDPLSVVLTLLSGAALAWLAIETLHRSFISGTQQSLARQQKQLRSVGETSFRGGFNRVVLLKEWRTIGRSPFLISKVFLQVLFSIPLLIVVLRGDYGGAIANPSTLIATASALLGSSMASSLTDICVSAEEAPDLLKSAPAKGTDLRRLKLLAALIPVWLLLSPLFIISIVRGEVWLMPLLVFSIATTSTAILRLWNSRPISATSPLERRQQHAVKDMLLFFLEMVAFFLWGFVGFQAGLGQIVPTLIGLAIGAALMAIAYYRSRKLGTSLGF
ncbi:MAG: hypothetical protein KME17_30505 [Cyanosarcina radialis HA8281-LM2]|jgi:ABC-2 type transport system permease protein|nr:hypothetical protein [Cyanosarcina radialis HA8281-LM2]